MLIVVLVILGFYYYDQNNKRAVAPTTEDQPALGEPSTQGGTGQQSATSAPETSQPTSTPAERQSQRQQAAPAEETEGMWSSGSEAEGMAPDILVTEVIYDGAKFSPQVTNLKVGDVVIFRNKSTKSFWPASDPHPQHSLYPELDPDKAVPAGGNWQFTFEKAGSWKFHDHLNPAATGTVNVAAR